MGGLIEAFFTVVQMLLEMVFSKKTKESESKKIPLKNLILMMICMAIFLGLINWLVSTLFHFFKQ
jgi:multisubunit Na+/H+ antiporter MnhB subunit